MGETNPNSNANANELPKKESQAAVEEGVFYPLDLSENEANDTDEKTTEKPNGDGEKKLQEILENITVETSQLNDIISEESKIINEVCVSLKEVLKKLHVSFNIPPQDIPLQKRTKRIVLNEDGNLALVYDNEQKHSAFLAEYPPDMVMAVLWAVIPELGKAITIYRKKMNARANFFGKMKKGLKVAADTIATYDQPKKPAERQIPDIEKESQKP